MESNPSLRAHLEEKEQIAPLNRQEREILHQLRQADRRVPSQEDFWRRQRAKPDFESQMAAARTYLRYTSRLGIQIFWRGKWLFAKSAKRYR